MCLRGGAEGGAEVQVLAASSLGCFMYPQALDPPQGDKHGNKKPAFVLFQFNVWRFFSVETKGARHNNGAAPSRGDVPLMAREHL